MDLQALIVTKAGSVAFFCLIAMAIVIFLRKLYGPKGIFRDKKWDFYNDLALFEQGQVPLWLEKHQQLFTQYAQTYLDKDPSSHYHLHLKLEHSKRVLDNAIQLIRHEEVFHDATLYKALLLTALYHDIGRFEQFTQYHTFADAASCNHGYLGKKILATQNFLANEPRYIRHLVYAGVAMHNRFSIAPSLPPAYITILKGIRDADKLDIMNILEEHLGKGKLPDSAVIMHLENASGCYSPKLVQALEQNIGASFLDMRYVNDFRILLCTWLPGIHYKTTRLALAKRRTLHSIVEGMDNIPEVQHKAHEYITHYFAGSTHNV